MVHELVVGLAQYAHLEHQVTATVEDIRRLLSGPRPYAEALLASRQGQTVGLALYFHNVSTFAGAPGVFLEDLFVKPEHRGHGVGRALLRAVAAVARDRGCRRLEWTALDWNKPALGFYERAGARVLKNWVVLRVDDDALARLAGP